MSSNAMSEETYEGEHVIPVPQTNPIQVILQRLWIIALVTAVVVGLAAGFSFLQTPTYQASATVLIGKSGGQSVNLQTEVQGINTLMKTMEEAVKTDPVAEDVIQRLELPVSSGAFLQNLTATQVPDTQFIDIKYIDPDPERAQLITNTVADVFSGRVTEVTPGTSGVVGTVWESAQVPGSPVSPDPVRNILLALVLGLMVGVGLAFLLNYLDDKWQSPEEAEQVSGVPTFGVIPVFKTPKDKQVEGEN